MTRVHTAQLAQATHGLKTGCGRLHAPQRIVADPRRHPNRLPLDRCRALVLNSDGRPMSVPFETLPWQDAVSGMITGRLNPLAFYEEEVRSQNMVVQIPSIVLSSTYVDLDTPAAFNRWNVLLAHQFNCAYCAGPWKHGYPSPETRTRGGEYAAGRFCPDDLTFDHIIPRSKGGRTTWDNIIPACRTCNEMKANLTPAQARMPLRFKPYQPTRARLYALALNHTIEEENLHVTWRDYLYWDSNLSP